MIRMGDQCLFIYFNILSSLSLIPLLVELILYILELFGDNITFNFLGI